MGRGEGWNGTGERSKAGREGRKDIKGRKVRKEGNETSQRKGGRKGGREAGSHSRILLLSLLLNLSCAAAPSEAKEPSTLRHLILVIMLVGLRVTHSLSLPCSPSASLSLCSFGFQVSLSLVYAL